MKVLVINGPNLNMLGMRDRNVYGSMDYEGLKRMIEERADELGIEVAFFQSNSEGEILNFLQKNGFSADGIIINAGAYSHYSYAIRDALELFDIPKVVVHISNVFKRENFRQVDVNMDVCDGGIIGLGVYGYLLALDYIFRKGAISG